MPVSLLVGDAKTLGVTKANNMKNSALYESLSALTRKSLEVIKKTIDRRICQFF